MNDYISDIVKVADEYGISDLTAIRDYMRIETLVMRDYTKNVKQGRATENIHKRSVKLLGCLYLSRELEK